MELVRAFLGVSGHPWPPTTPSSRHSSTAAVDWRRARDHKCLNRSVIVCPCPCGLSRSALSSSLSFTLVCSRVVASPLDDTWRLAGRSVTDLSMASSCRPHQPTWPSLPPASPTHLALELRNVPGPPGQPWVLCTRHEQTQQTQQMPGHRPASCTVPPESNLAGSDPPHPRCSKLDPPCSILGQLVALKRRNFLTKRLISFCSPDNGRHLDIPCRRYSTLASTVA